MSSLRDDAPRFEAADTVIHPVNPAPVERHARWAAKQGFPFAILSDPDKAVAKSYGAKGLVGISRTVFVVDKEGRIAFRESGMPADEKLLQAIAERNAQER